MIGEFRLIEAYMYASIEQQTHDPYTCEILHKPYLHCLDMGSFTNPSIAPSEAGDFDIETNITDGRDVYDIFGQGPTCAGKKHGDGMINVFDLSLVLAYIFGRFPSLSSDPSMVTTGLQGRSDVHTRCDTNESAYDYAAAYAIDNCIVALPVNEEQARSGENDQSTGRRRKQRQLQEPRDMAILPKLEVDVDTFAETPHGNWYRISIHKPYPAIDMKLTRIAWPIGQEREVELSNHPYPRDRRAPFLTEGILQLRFAHPCEYANADANECAFAGECAIIMAAAG
eukprot:6214838-Pleurochrysis_carterae.AAC.1